MSHYHGKTKWTPGPEQIIRAVLAVNENQLTYHYHLALRDDWLLLG